MVIDKNGEPYKSKLNFGTVTGYEIKNMSGNSVEARIEDDYILVVKGLEYGATAFDISDNRGTIVKVNVQVPYEQILTSGLLSFEMKPDEMCNISLLYQGKGWKILDYQRNFFSIVTIHQPPGVGEYGEYEYLQVNTSPDKYGMESIILEHPSGVYATVSIMITQ